MAKLQRAYRCSACGFEAPAFEGRCRQCGEWNSMELQERVATSAVTAVGRGRALDVATMPLETVDLEDAPRMVTGLQEFDRVLGGGLVPGSIVLVGGEPGIGKSTLMLQAADRLAAAGIAVAYLCGEESPRQIRMRASRLGVAGGGITLIPATTLDGGLAAAERSGAAVFIIDSIQAVGVEGLDTRTGGPAQLGEAGARILGWSKSTGIATVFTGHVTKAGEIAGPRLLEHLVDAVLYFESSDSGQIRILRAVKNRFGATDELGVFEMTGQGLRSVENPSAAFLEAIDPSASGCAVTAVIEGTRPLAVEVQALAVPTHLATPRRVASGLEPSRLHVLLAVLARRGGMQAGTHDVVTTISGGLRLRDPGADLAVVVALASALCDEAVVRETAFLGEVALTGVIRPAQQPQRLLQELARLGFRRCVVAQGTQATAGIELIPVRTVREALAVGVPRRRGGEASE